MVGDAFALVRWGARADMEVEPGRTSVTYGVTYPSVVELDWLLCSVVEVEDRFMIVKNEV